MNESLEEIERREERRSLLREMIGNLRPLYYAGVGFGTGYFYEDVFGQETGAMGTSRDLFNATLYVCLDNCFRKEGREMTGKEILIVILSNSVGRIIRNMN